MFNAADIVVLLAISANLALAQNLPDATAPVVAGSEEVPRVEQFCTCQGLLAKTMASRQHYLCEARGAKYNGEFLWNKCSYSEESCSGSNSQHPLYTEVGKCIDVLTELQGNLQNLHEEKFSDLRCCLSNDTPAKQQECAIYVCTNKFLLYMPYGCQTEFLARGKDTQCRKSPEESILMDCHERECDISLLKFDSRDMFYMIGVVASGTFLCAVFATIYVKRKSKRMVEWAKLERKVLGGEGGEDDLLDILAQKQRKARVWYYVSKQGKVVGPLKEEDMRLRKVAGLFDEGLMVRCNDSDWKTLSKFYRNPELEAFEAKTRPMLTNNRRR